MSINGFYLDKINLFFRIFLFFGKFSCKSCRLYDISFVKSKLYTRDKIIMQPKPIEWNPTPLSQFNLFMQRASLGLSIAIPSYYSLGFAYKTGLMARIDLIAIEVLSHFTGYMGVAIWMPTVQWYAAVGVRIAAGAVCGLLYTIIEKVAKKLYGIYVVKSQEMEKKISNINLSHKSSEVMQEA
jgi:hypothetical protein